MMNKSAPMLFTWTDEGVFRPLPRFERACDREFAVGEVYRLEAQEQRSMVSHNHYFAALNDIWASLPEEFGDRIASPEHLRKFALIRKGYRDERSVVCASKAEAKRVAGFIKPMDDFAIVAVDEATVTVYTAKSQSMKAMGKEQFQKSKSDVLDYCLSLLERRAA